MSTSCSIAPETKARTAPCLPLYSRYIARYGDGVTESSGLQSFVPREGLPPRVFFGALEESLVLADALMKSALTDLGRTSNDLQRSGVSVEGLVETYRWLHALERLLVTMHNTAREGYEVA